MFKASAEFHANRDSSSGEDVADTAQVWYEIANRIVSEKEKPKKEEKRLS